MNLNDLRMSLKAALDNMWARIDARITAIEQGGGGGGVTSVNGQTGDVSITPANIGAVDANEFTISAWGVNGESILANNGIYARSYNPNILPSQGVPTGFSEYSSVLSVIGPTYPIAAYIDVFGSLSIWNSNQNRWELYHKNGYVYGITEGGTGVTQGTIDITDYCTFPTGNVNTSSPYGGRLYYNPYLNCVFGTIMMNDGASVNNQADIVYLKKDSSGTPLIANREMCCGVCIHSATSPVVAPRITGSTIKSSHTTGDPINTPRYTIMAFLG